MAGFCVFQMMIVPQPRNQAAQTHNRARIDLRSSAGGPG